MKIQSDSQIVIVPWDFSELAAQGLLWAVATVDDPAKIRVIHVAPMPVPMDYGVAWSNFSEKETTESATAAFREKWKDHSQLSEIAFAVLFGDPGTQICDFAKEQNAGMILIPSHGRTGLGRFVMGSVAERVVRYAPCPVLVMRGAHPDSPHENSDAADASAELV